MVRTLVSGWPDTEGAITVRCFDGDRGAGNVFVEMVDRRDNRYLTDNP